MDAQPNPTQPELSRLLLVADASVDAHRLVRVCCEHCWQTPLSVSLLVAADHRSWPWAESRVRGETLLLAGAKLLDAAGFRVENVVLDGEGLGQLVRSGGFDALLLCSGDGQLASPILPLAARLADLNRLPVLDDRRRAVAPTAAGWLRRVVDPLLRWQRSWERTP